jgi:hypothetical protein
MTLYAANPNKITSPPLIVVLCSLIFLFSMADVLADIFGPDAEAK